MEKKYAKDMESALEYCNKYHADMFFKERSFDCACGESSGLEVLDPENRYEEVERIIICEACYESAANHDRV